MGRSSRSRRFLLANVQVGLLLAGLSGFSAAPASGQGATLVWQGTISDDWHVAGNWALAQIPTAADNVQIPLVTAPAAQPFIRPASTDAFCLNLDLSAGAGLGIGPGRSLFVGADAAIGPGGAISIGIGGAFDVSGSLTGGAGATLTGPGTTRTGGPVPSTCSWPGSACHIVIDKTPGTTLTVIGTLHVVDSLTLTNGNVVMAPGAVLDVDGDVFLTGGSFDGTAAGSVQIHDVTWSGTVLPNLPANAPPLITCTGSWDVSAPNGFQPTSGVVAFAGSPVQTLSGSVTASFFGLQVASGSTLQVTSPLAIAGVLDANGPLLLGAGPVQLASGTHTIAAGLGVGVGVVVQGTGAVISFDGPGVLLGAAGVVLPPLSVALTSGALVATGPLVTGGLTLNSGTLNLQSGLLSVLGTATFSGGTLVGDLSSAAPAQIDVAGSVAFTGTASTLPPGIRLQGSWTSGAGFVPMQGLVTFDGASPAIGGSSPARFHDLAIASGTLATSSVPLDVGGTLTVAGGLALPVGTTTIHGAASVPGSLTGPANVNTRQPVTISGTVAITGPLDADAHVEVTSAGSLSLPPLTHNFGGGIEVGAGGALTAAGGTLRFDGGGSIDTPGNFILPQVLIDAGSGTVDTASSFDIASDLTVLSGVFHRNGGDIDVGGQALFQGGRFRGSAPQSLDVSQNVTFAGTVGTDVGDISIAGSTWSSVAPFAPDSGTVTFVLGNQTISGAGTFFDVRIAAGSSTTVAASVPGFTVNTLTVEGNLNLNSTGAANQIQANIVLAGSGTIGGASGSLVVSLSAFVNAGSTFTYPGDLTVGQNLQLDGTLVLGTPGVTQPGILDVNGDLIIGLGGALVLHSPGPHFAGGSVLVTGTTDNPAGQPPISSTAAGAALYLDGQGSLQYSASEPIGVRLAIVPSGDVTITGNVATDADFHLAGGTLRLADGALLEVAQNFVIQSGALAEFGPGLGVIDVSGTVSVLGGTVSLGSTLVRARGDWLTTAASPPAWGQVAFAGTAAQTVGGSVLRASEIVVEGPGVTATVLFEVAGSLDVEGFLNAQAQVSCSSLAIAPGGSMLATRVLAAGAGADVDIRGSLTASVEIDTIDLHLRSGGSLDLGGTAPLVVRGDLTCETSFTGSLLRLLGAGTVAVPSTPGFVLPSTQVQGFGTVAFTASTTISGTLSVLGGTLAIVNGSTLRVTGASDFTGGTLREVNGAATLELDGAVTWTGTSGAAGIPRLSCSSSWTSDAGFAPAGGLVRFEGTGTPQLVSAPGSVFPDVEIPAGVQVSFLSGLSTSGDLDLLGSATGTQSWTIGGDFDLSAGGSAAGIAGLTVAGSARIAGTMPTIPVESQGNLTIESPATLAGLEASADVEIRSTVSVLQGSLLVPGRLTVNSGGSLTLPGDLTAGGVSVAAGGTLVLAPGAQLEMRGNLTVGGALSGPASLRMSASGLISRPVAQPLVLPPVEIDFMGLAGMEGPIQITGNLAIDGATLALFANASVAVAGDLAVEFGSVTLGGGALLSIGDDASFSSSHLSAVPNSGTFDVAGDISLAGTGVTEPPGEIRCGGAWISDAAFQPGSGVVVFDGGSQPVSVPTASTWFSIRGEPGSQIVVPGAATVRGGLDVRGAFTLAGGTTVAGSVTVAASGSLLAQAALSIAGSCQVSGTATAAGAFTLTGALTITGTGTLNLSTGAVLDVGSFTTLAGAQLGFPTGTTLISHGSITLGSPVASLGQMVMAGPGILSVPGAGISIGQIRVDAPGPVLLNGPITIAGSLELVQATLTVSGLVQVQGPASFLGGRLTSANGVTSQGTLDLDGPALFSGTTVVEDGPLFLASASWTSNAAFAPNSGRVTFDGTSPQTVAASGTFADLTVNGTSVTSIGALAVDGEIRIGGSLNVGGGVSAGTDLILMPSGVLLASGSLAVGRDLEAAASLNVNGSLSVGRDLRVTAATVTVNVSSILGVGGRLFAAGTVSAVSLPAPIESLDIDPTGSLHLPGTPTLAIAGSLSVDGPLTGPTRVRVTGPGLIAATQPLPILELDFPGLSGLQGSVTTAGFELRQGTLYLFSGALLTVLGPAFLLDGTLGALGASVVDVNGPVTCGTVSAFSPAPSIRCSGDWTALGTPGLPFAVTLDGAGVQAISGPAVRFESLVVSAGSHAIAAAALDVGGLLQVNGRLDLAAVSRTRDSLVPAGGILDAAARLDVTGNGTFQGTVTPSSQLRFIGAGTISGAATLPAIGIDASGTVTLAGTLALAGLTLDGGVLHCGAGSAISVSGPASFLGGTLTAAGPAVLDVGGNVVFAGCTAAAPPDLLCAGDWSADAGFAPISGRVTLDGTGLTTFGAATPAGVLDFHELRIVSGPHVAAGPLTIAATQIELPAGSEVRTGAHRVAIADGGGALPVPVQGTLSIGAGGELALAPGVSLTVPPGGRLELLGTPSQTARIAAEGPAGHALAIAGALAAEYGTFQGMGPGGVVIADTAVLDPAPRDLRNATFVLSSPAAGARCLDIERSQPTMFDGAVFTAAVTPGAGACNVRAVSGAALLFTAWGGSFGGPAFECDPASLIGWGTFFAPPVSFQAEPGPGRVRLSWQTALAPASGFRVDRERTGGTWTLVAEASLAPAGVYAVDDLFLPAGIPVTYRLSESRPGTGSSILAYASAAPLPASLLPTVLSAGPGGMFPDPAAALAAATLPGTVIVLDGGPWPAFRIQGPMPSGLRLVSRPGTRVRIDAAAGPWEIFGFPVGHGIVVERIDVTGPSGGGTAVHVAGCDGVVVLDGVAVPDGTVLIEGCAGVAVQDSGLLGTPGLRVGLGSAAQVLGGVVSSLEILSGTVEVAGTIVPATVAAGASFTQHLSSPLRIHGPSFAAAGGSYSLQLEGFPGLPFGLGVGRVFGWNVGLSPGQMLAAILDPAALDVALTGVAGVAGSAVQTFDLPAVLPAPVAGLTLHWQGVQAGPAGTLLCSNLGTTTLIP